MLSTKLQYLKLAITYCYHTKMTFDSNFYNNQISAAQEHDLITYIYRYHCFKKGAELSRTSRGREGKQSASSEAFNTNSIRVDYNQLPPVSMRLSVGTGLVSVMLLLFFVRDCNSNVFRFRFGWGYVQVDCWISGSCKKLRLNFAFASTYINTR